MSKLDPATRKQIIARVDYYREMGIHDFYRRPVPESPAGEVAEPAAEAEIAAGPAVSLFDSPLPVMTDKKAALQAVREDIGDCTRCRLHKGRKNIVFGVGNVNADLMFVGEGPGADEDEQGEPFVGRAGQLLNNMIAAMGLKRSDVYIANVVKCRPPQNRTPEKDECDTCSPFLMRQIEIIRPKVIVALGAVAAKNLLAVNDSMANLRGRWYEFKSARLAVTYHPAFLLRDPRQKKEAWKDLQMVMKYLGLKPKAGSSPEA
jgi:uracil-DNA glycosylase